MATYLKIDKLYQSFVKEGLSAGEIMKSLAKYIDNHPKLRKDVNKKHLFHKTLNYISYTSNHIENKIYDILNWGLTNGIFTINDLRKCYFVIIGHFNYVMYSLNKVCPHRMTYSHLLETKSQDVVYVLYKDIQISSENDYLEYTENRIGLIDFLTYHASNFSANAKCSWGHGKQFHRSKEKEKFEKCVEAICDNIVTFS